jgi:tellurite resistance protein
LSAHEIRPAGPAPSRVDRDRAREQAQGAAMSGPISHHDALIYVMVLVSAADAQMSDRELKEIGEIVTKFPVFRDFDPEKLVKVAEDCGAIMADDGGLQQVLEIVARTLPDKLRATAYAVAVEVATADDKLGQEELRVLELLRHALQIDRLYAGAIEYSAKVRHRTA